MTENWRYRESCINTQCQSLIDFDLSFYTGFVMLRVLEGVLATLTNLLTIVAVVRGGRSGLLPGSPANVLIANLAMVDLLHGVVFCTLFPAASFLQSPTALCLASQAVTFGIIFMEMAGFLFIAVERFVNLRGRLRGRGGLSRSTTVGMVVGSWVFSSAGVLIITLHWAKGGATTNECIYVNVYDKAVAYFSVVAFLVVTLVTTAVYAGVVAVVMKRGLGQRHPQGSLKLGVVLPDLGAGTGEVERSATTHTDQSTTKQGVPATSQQQRATRVTWGGLKIRDVVNGGHETGTKALGGRGATVGGHGAVVKALGGPSEAAKCLGGHETPATAVRGHGATAKVLGCHGAASTTFGGHVLTEKGMGGDRAATNALGGHWAAAKALGGYGRRARTNAGHGQVAQAGGLHGIVENGGNGHSIKANSNSCHGVSAKDGEHHAATGNCKRHLQRQQKLVGGQRPVGESSTSETTCEVQKRAVNKWVQRRSRQIAWGGRQQATTARRTPNTLLGANGTVGRRHVRLTKMLALVVGLYVALYVPHVVLVIITDRGDLVGLVQATVLISDINFWINPLIYAWKSRDFRKAFKKILGHRLGKALNLIPPTKTSVIGVSVASYGERLSWSRAPRQRLGTLKEMGSGWSESVTNYPTSQRCIVHIESPHITRVM